LLKRLKKGLPHALQLMHVAVTVDEIGCSSHLLLESV
jgi:hypothetical protein